MAKPSEQQAERRGAAAKEHCMEVVTWRQEGRLQKVLGR